MKKKLKTQPTPDAKLSEAIEAAMENEQTPVYIDSLEACIGYGSLLRELQKDYMTRFAYFRSADGGSNSPDDARAMAYQACRDETEGKRLYDRIMGLSVMDISFSHLSELWPAAPEKAEEIWEMMKLEARDEFESGHLASHAMVPAGLMRTAWNVASYIGMRESLIDDWRPRGAMELSLIDGLAQAYFLYQYWVGQSVLRTQTKPREPHPDFVRWWGWNKPGQALTAWSDAGWEIPFVCERNAIEHAAQMADRWNRIYLRTLRNLRDLRRYCVTINNPQQVNIAADGGQQVNVAG
jgi:hypothetical protein